MKTQGVAIWVNYKNLLALPPLIMISAQILKQVGSMRYFIAFILVALLWLGYSFVLSAFSSFEIAGGLAAGIIGAVLLYLFDRYLKRRYPQAGRYLIGVVLVVLLVILGAAGWLWFKPLPVDTLLRCIPDPLSTGSPAAPPRTHSSP